MSHHIDDYVKAYEVKGERHFARDYAAPVLIGLRVVGALEEAGERGEAQTFLAALHGEEQESQSLNRRVWPIVKSPYGPQTRYVRVGRSAQNDMVIPEYSISQVHCAFALDAAGRLKVADLGSHNGTLLNDLRLTPHRGEYIEDEDELVLGRYLFEYLDAATFIQRVAVMASARAALKGRPRR